MVKLAAHNGLNLGSSPGGATNTSALEIRRKNRMEYIDSLPRETRELVKEYGFPVVKALLDLNIKKPRQIRHVVETVLDEFSPTRGSFSKQRNV